MSEGGGEGDGGGLRRRMAGRLAAAFPGPWHDLQLRRRPGQFDAALRLIPALLTRGQRSIGVGVDGSWVRALGRGGGEVLAFEPDPARAPALRRMGGPRLRIELVVLSDRAAAAGLRRLTGDDAGTGGPERVEARTLDSFAVAHVALMRISGRRAEEIVRGAEATIPRCRPVLLIGDQASSLATVRLVEALARWNYRPFSLGAEGLAPADGGELILLPVERSDLRAAVERAAQPPARKA